MDLVGMRSEDVGQAIQGGAVLVLPVGAIEQHGPHLPVGTDTLIVHHVALAAAQRTGDIVAPPVAIGYNQKELAFPGTLSAKLETLTQYVRDICESGIKTGFRRLLILNGHGWNKPAISSAAHLVAEGPTEALCAAASYYDLISDVASEVRESEFPGGMAHAGEFETSLALHLGLEGISPEKARKEVSFPRSRFSWLDIVAPPKFSIPRVFTQYTQSGVIGDPELATAEKGKRLFDAAVTEVAEFLQWFRECDTGQQSSGSGKDS